MTFEETLFGFQWGAAKIERLFCDEKKGWVTLELETPKKKLQIYVTKTGKVRIHTHGGQEWKEVDKDDIA